MRFLNSMQVDKGRLQVSVGIENLARPIENAKVSIYGKNNSGEQVKVEEINSDISGRGALIELPTPPIEYSLIPGSPMPYSVYDLEISAIGYEPLTLRDVQILPNVTALANVSLNLDDIEIQEQQRFRRERNIKKQEINRRQIVVIQPHTLFKEFPEKEPEDEVKSLPPPTGFVVLDRVVVPEIIVVHDGVPDNPNAPLYYVPFRDYIKNVASSEIYATWPLESLKANILTIISFTLNRVFTEWYRNKGKNFTITSSTATDQAYVHGRNIFAEISEVVDDIFTSYITRPNIRQPLFTQYSDGIRVRRDGWLSQWGSKDLADTGRSSTEILRHYYGSSVYLDTAIKVAGIPSSFPGYALNIGATGDNVRKIQTQINSISNNYPALPKVAVDGIYGQQLAISIRKFQEIFNMPVSGVVDFATWYKLSQVYVAVERMAS